jgi:3-deoxy-D-manno-octulosonate 8-phosphate phosphatase (KDO 8-P phosphatase)
MALTAIERARRIKIILFDVDGVLTDGGIWLFPTAAVGGCEPTAFQDVVQRRLSETGDKPGYGIQSTTMVEAKGFNAHDGTSISLARLAGIKTGVITKRISETVALRARDLKLDFVYMGQSYKMQAVREIIEKSSATLEEVAYVGDDIIDLPVMRKVGLAIAVANAREQVKAAAHYITPNGGGHGAARDAVEFVLETQGMLERVIEEYIDERNPMAPSMDIGKGGF